MAGQVSVDWPTCDEDGCIGIRLDAGDKCLAHAGDEERDAALKQVAQTGKIDARGVTISSTLLMKILDSTPRNPVGLAMLSEVRFDGATFQGDADFGGNAGIHGPTFQGNAWFGEATFQGDAGFTGATFQGYANFDGAIFQGAAQFYEATFRNPGFEGATFQQGAVFTMAAFQGNAPFYGATFQGFAGFLRAGFQSDVWFTGVTFQRHAWFEGAYFEGDAWFTAFVGDAAFTIFEGDAEFTGATFQGKARFTGATFKGEARFGGATFKGSAAQFNGATFERAQQFGPLLAHRGLNLDAVQFALPVQVEASTPGLCCRRTRFPGGVQFRLRWARVVLDDTDLSAPSLLTGIPRLADDELALAEQRIARAWKRLFADEISQQPRLLSLQRANVAGLGLGNVDLAGCRFNGAHNLDKLQLEGDVAFKLSPARLRWDWRLVVAEECTWRADRTRPGRWTAPWWPDWAGSERPAVQNPGVIAGLYRALRKGREDAKDAPGAADFYYGEMEMRRHAHGQADGSQGWSGGQVERGVLTAYWLVSGYGLRAWRALAWFAGIAVAFALAFHLVGFTRPPQPATYWTSLLYAFQSTISLTDDQVTLTAWGQLLQALLRLTGPVLLGLALLALRGRIKR